MRWRTRSGVTCGCMSWSRLWPSWHDKHSGVLIGSSVTWLFDWTRACNYTRRARRVIDTAREKCGRSHLAATYTVIWSWVELLVSLKMQLFILRSTFSPIIVPIRTEDCIWLMKLKLTRPQITWRWRKSPSYCVTNLLSFILLWNTRKIISSLHK